MEKLLYDTGVYKGNASWSGSIWSLINEMVIRGLSDCGEDALAAELAVKTVMAFNGKYAEFLNPFDGTGQGVLQYAWTASQYLEIIIEILFGICYHAEKGEVTVSPKLTDGLKNCCLSLKGVKLTEDTFIDVVIDHGVVSYSVNKEKS